MCMGWDGQFSTVPTEAEKGIGFPGAGADQHRCWEQSSGPLQEQTTLLTSS